LAVREELIHVSFSGQLQAATELVPNPRKLEPPGRRQHRQHRTVFVFEKDGFREDMLVDVCGTGDSETRQSQGMVAEPIGCMTIFEKRLENIR
jgi:hypothetical protein